MARIVRDVALILLFSVLLFAAVNAAAWIWLRSSGHASADWAWHLQVRPGSNTGIELRERVFATTDRDYLRDLAKVPDLRPHTVLHFTSGKSNAAYTVGTEAVRYSPEWNDEFVTAALESNAGVFVLGGSTTFGMGVGDGQTLVSYLNRARPGRTHLNFGVLSYDSLREVDRLLYLLRQGYRPAEVVFVDGLNDISTFIGSPYRAFDKPKALGFLIDRGETPLISGLPVPETMLQGLVYALPVTHVYTRLTDEQVSAPYGSLDANIDDLDYRAIAWHYDNQFGYGEDNLDEIVDDWVSYYARHIEFVRSLGETFGFRATFVFQPIGLTDRRNPFLKPGYFDTVAVRVADAFTAAIVAAIEAGNLDMLDCHRALEGVDGSLAYVDPLHYSPQGNEALAACIAANSDSLQGLRMDITRRESLVPMGLR